MMKHEQIVTGLYERCQELGTEFPSREMVMEAVAKAIQVARDEHKESKRAAAVEVKKAETAVEAMRKRISSFHSQLCSVRRDMKDGDELIGAISVLCRRIEKERAARPPIVCLCGSTKFKEEYLQVAVDETLADRIVLSANIFTHADEYETGPETKEMLDRLHLAKIDLADDVFVINPEGYIGESTKAQIDYTVKSGKPIRWLYPELAPEEHRQKGETG